LTEHLGDDWLHVLAHEGLEPADDSLTYPRCAAGKGRCPPEDCGGLDAYHDMLACIKEPQTELGREWLEWLGPDYDPELCDLEKINKALKKLGK